MYSHKLPTIQLDLYAVFAYMEWALFKYTEQQKKHENLLLLNWLKIKYVEFEKYILHVKLTV